MANKIRPIHPGEILREEFLNELDLSPNALAVKLHVPASRIDQIVKEKRALSPDTALRLAHFFGGTAGFWMNLQSTYDLKVAESKLLEKVECLVNFIYSQYLRSVRHFSLEISGPSSHSESL